MDQQGLLKCTNKNLQVSAPISIRNCSNFAGIGVSSRCKQKFTSAHACKLLAQSGAWALQKSSFGKFGLCKKAPLVYLGSAKEPHDLNTSCSHGLFGHVPRQGDTWSPSPETVSALMAFQSAHSTSSCIHLMVPKGIVLQQLFGVPDMELRWMGVGSQAGWHKCNVGPHMLQVWQGLEGFLS